MKANVFFSYSREDSEFALKLGRDLRAAGATIWLDQLDIHPGERWDVSVQAALAGCAKVLVILSPASVGSQNVMDEVSYALEENKLVVPVLYRDCSVPFRLRRLQHTDFRGNHQEALNKLVAHLIAPPGDASASPTLAPADGRVGAGAHAPRHDPAVAVAGPSNPPVNVRTRAFGAKAWLAAAMAVVLIVGAWAISSMLGGPTIVDKSPTPSDKWGLVVPTYVVTAGAFKTEREAQALRDKLRSQGYKASHLWIPDYQSLSGAQLFLTFVGPFADIEECRRQLAEFKKVQAGAYGILVSHQTDRVQFTR